MTISRAGQVTAINRPSFICLLLGNFTSRRAGSCSKFAGVALAGPGNFPGAMQPRLVLGQVLPQGGKVHLHKETVKIPVQFSQVLPVQQRRYARPVSDLGRSTATRAAVHSRLAEMTRPTAEITARCGGEIVGIRLILSFF